MVISATGDEFFSPDDSYSWYKDMKGPTYMRLLPNAEHGMIPPQALSSPTIVHGIRAFYLAGKNTNKWHFMAAWISISSLI